MPSAASARSVTSPRRPDAIWVNRTKAVIPLSRPTRFGASPFDEGITEYLEAGELPAAADVHDDFGYASGALCYDLDVAPGIPQDVYLAIPFGARADTHDAPLLPAGISGAEQFDAAVREWRDRLAAVDIRLPAAHAAIDTLKTAAAHILINRDGPALQPGPRRYTRSWIRDGAIMGAALLRVGCTDAMREFIRWYAPYQRDDGFVPCCVDRDGPDWLVEHDSHGQLVYAVMEDFRFTRDRAFLAEMWPAVIKAVDCIEGLRNSRLTPEFQSGGQARLLRPAARVGQPRRVSGASGALVLGRLLGTARPQGCRGHGRDPGRSGARTAARCPARRPRQQPCTPRFAPPSPRGS